MAENSDSEIYFNTCNEKDKCSRQLNTAENGDNINRSSDNNTDNIQSRTTNGSEVEHHQSTCIDPPEQNGRSSFYEHHQTTSIDPPEQNGRSSFYKQSSQSQGRYDLRMVSESPKSDHPIQHKRRPHKSNSRRNRSRSRSSRCHRQTDRPYRSSSSEMSLSPIRSPRLHTRHYQSSPSPCYQRRRQHYHRGQYHSGDRRYLLDRSRERYEHRRNVNHSNYNAGGHIHHDGDYDRCPPPNNFCHPRNSSVPSLKPEPYSGQECWEEYCSHFENCAELGNWDNRNKVLFLAASLRGQARTFYMSLDPHQRQDYCTLAYQMQHRFGSSIHAGKWMNMLEARQRKKQGRVSLNCVMSYASLPRKHIISWIAEVRMP